MQVIAHRNDIKTLRLIAFLNNIMKISITLLKVIVASTSIIGSNSPDTLSSNTVLQPDSVQDATESIDLIEHCKFNLSHQNGTCLSPTEITVAPPRKQLPPAAQPFPGKIVLTVVSATSTMVGDIKCTGVDDHLKIQLAIDNMNMTGGTVILSDGKFYLNAPILLCNKLKFMGQGMNITILFVNNYAPEYPRAGTVRGYAVKNVIMQDMQVDGNRFYNPGDAYVKGPAYGKFGLFCESCIDVMYLRVGNFDFKSKARKVTLGTGLILMVPVRL
jgi:hypothetical protein